MIDFKEVLVFGLAALALAITPGPNMVYLISRSVTQGKAAGLLSLVGVVCGFLFHIIMVAFGLTAILLAVPFAFSALKIGGCAYLLYLAYNAVRPGAKGLFDKTTTLSHDKPIKLFTMGLLTNVLNPKMGVFYLSLFPQFIKVENGSVLLQCITLGCIQMSISFVVNFVVIITSARIGRWFESNPAWIRFQKWIMAGVLTSLAVKMITAKQH